MEKLRWWVLHFSLFYIFFLIKKNTHIHTHAQAKESKKKCKQKKTKKKKKNEKYRKRKKKNKRENQIGIKKILKKKKEKAMHIGFF